MTSKRVLDFILCVVTGTIIATLALWATISADLSHEAFITWVPFVGNTALIFGFTVYYHRAFLRRVSFWGLICALLLVHTFVVLAVLRIVGYWQIAWWMVGVLPELILLHIVIRLFGFAEIRRRKQNEGSD
jgi:hypothetical protein